MMPFHGPETVARFHTKYQIHKDTGCWIWKGSARNGYGQFYAGRGGGMWYIAHRWSFEEAYGEIPEGWQIHHKCRTRRCVNPEHLQAVTPAEHNEIHHKH